MTKRPSRTAFVAMSLLVLVVVILASPIASPVIEGYYVTRRSHLIAAGVTLQEPHVRALNTGMR